jgi:hypothetical protein
MKSSASNHCNRFGFALALCVAVTFAAPAIAIPSFLSHDYRLPNPDRPYEMVGDTVHYDTPFHFAIYDLEFAPSNPSQLDIPTRNPDGSLDFDSTFDISYRAVIGVSTQPPSTVLGTGTARARGHAPADPNHEPYQLIWPNPQVFDTELVELNLFALSPIPEVMFRESPSLRSSGVIIREDTCPYCLSPITIWRISSFLDVATEITFNGGNTWTPASDLIHVEQAPDGFPPGDYNHDHEIDGADYVVWRKTLGQTGAGLLADGNWNGIVDHADVELIRKNFASIAGSGSTAPAVPEPGVTIIVFEFALLALMRRSTRRRIR